jgi:transmembrane sensor
VKEEYLKITLEELIEDREFIGWVLHSKNNKEWENFLAKNVEFRSKAKKARKIVELLRDTHDQLKEEEVLTIWKNIEKYDNLIKDRSRKIKLQRYFSYAAILIVALFIGGMGGYWLLSNNQQTYIFSEDTSFETGAQSKLHLSDGTTVDIEKENSKIVLNPDDKILIDNNRVIDLKETANDNLKMNEVVVPYGKKSQLTLADGTRVWLNAGSKMAFPSKFKGKKREVFIEGEAYFEVAHNNDVPFYANAGEISIKVLGTKFNLSAYKTEKLVETILIEGQVAVSERIVFGLKANETILSPNQKATYNKELKTISVKYEPDVEMAIAWTDGWFKFSKQSLSDVLKKLERYYNIRFEFDKGFSTSDLITGKLDLKESIEQVMVALTDVTNIDYIISENIIYIEKNNR